MKIVISFLLWITFLLTSLVPQFAKASVIYNWFVQDGSDSSGQLIINAPSSGGFDLPQSAVTSFEFVFGPGMTVSLGDWEFLLANVGIVSFDGRFLDNGVYDLRSTQLGILAFNTFSGGDPLRRDTSQYDPSGQNHLVVGHWVREGFQPLPPTPAPEPTSIALLSLGLAGLVFARRKMKT
jgi:hypothetical protein